MEDNFWNNLEKNLGELFASLSEIAKGLSKDEEKTSVRSRFEKRVLKMAGKAQVFKDAFQMNAVWGKENDCQVGIGSRESLSEAQVEVAMVSLNHFFLFLIKFIHHFNNYILFIFH